MTNIYICFEDGAAEAVVIDPASNAQKISAVLKQEGLCCAAILLTHGHFDHIDAADELRSLTGAPLFVHAEDADMLTSEEMNGSAGFGFHVVCRPAEHTFCDGEELNFGGMTFRVIHTPGHTPGSCCFDTGAELFTGDTLFHLSIGRTDLPGGDFETLKRSLMKLEDKIEGERALYPGHDTSSSFEYEKCNNPFMSGR